VAAVFQRVSHQHRGHCEQPEQAKRIHRLLAFLFSFRLAKRLCHNFPNKPLCAARFRATTIVFKSIESLRAATLV
jgi:hypothetical protein